MNMKRLIYKSILFFVVLMMSFSLYGTTSLKNDSEKKNTVPTVNVRMPFTKGLNLTKWLEPFGFGNSSSTHFGKSDFVDIKSLGVEIVRIPIHFEQWSLGKPDYIIPDWLWEKIDSAVEWCTELKMYMIIDFHNACDAASKTKPDVEKMLLKIWEQIATRYKDSSEYVLYEIMNEPHFKSGNNEADLKKWGKIQGNVLKLIRSIDKKHTVIVGAELWNSLNFITTIPDYDDDNLIYNFHDYSPFLFTHQGAEWTDINRLQKIPFPYVKEKMPPLPKNATASEVWHHKNYEKEASEEVLVEPLNKAVEFANKRNVALMCNEYGVYMNHADKEERASWYRIKSKWFEERGIIRVSWDYTGGLGIFNNHEGNFPEDLNVELIKAMGLNVPPMTKRVRYTWIESATKKNDYTIYKNGLAENVRFDGWLQSDKEKVDFFKKDFKDDDSYIYIPNAKAYNSFQFDFRGICDLSQLKDSGKKLEFEIRSNQKDLRLDVYFRNKDDPSNGIKGKPWRCGVFLRKSWVTYDGQWHKVSIPLTKFKDYGAWDNYENKWYNSEQQFDWKKIEKLCFDFAEIPCNKDVSIRNIQIK